MTDSSDDIQFDKQVARWLIVISGFTQSASTPNGLEQLWLKLRTITSGDMHTSVQLKTWRDDFSGLAERIWRLRPNGGVQPDVRIFAYSWGCGHGFVKLSRELQKRGIPVRAAVLCDPVYHSWYAPWRAVWSFIDPTIKVPANVREVWSLFQDMNRPRGHQLRLASDNTNLHIPIHCRLTHQYMDDSENFHSIAIKAATSKVEK